MVAIPWRPSGLDSALILPEPGWDPRRGTEVMQTTWEDKKKKGEEKETNYDWPFKLEVTLYDNN